MNVTKRYIIFMSIFSVFVLMFSAIGWAGIIEGNNNEYLSGEVIVKFKPHVSAKWTTLNERKKGVEDESRRVGVKASLKKRFPLINAYQIDILDTSISVKEAVKRFKSNPNVEYAEPNYIYKIHYTPNDPLFNQLWGLNNTGQTGGTVDADIDATEAWDIQRGSNNLIIGVIDTGVDFTHEDLSANMWINPFEILDGVDNDGNGYVDDIHGINAINGSGYPMDDNGHGTHVAGTIGAVGDNGKGISGVNHRVNVMALKFLDANGSGYLSDAIECIQYVVDMKRRGINIRVTNNSWGGGGYSQALYDAIRLLRDNDILFVAAAGNSGSNNDAKPFYPASYAIENIISVAATDHNDNLASFSNYGANSVHVAAPGVNILSTLPGGGGYTPNEGNIFFDNMESGGGNWIAHTPWAITSEQNYTTGGLYSLSDSPYSNYANNTNASIISNPINLSGQTGDLRLGFWIRGILENNYDYLYIEASADSGISWTILGSITGTISSWKLMSYPIPPSLRTSDFRFRFRLYTDYSVVYDGVYIDNIGIGIGTGSNNYGRYSGTSMATPHVAGLAGLINAENPNLTYVSVKNTILNTVDIKPYLTGKVLTGGRINAYNALLSLGQPPSNPPVAPSNLIASTVSTSQINLTWTDNSTDETGFRIERRTSTGSYVEIATVGANVRSYSDTGLNESTTYYYRVRAYNSAGYSEYSNEASALTLPAAPSNLTATAISRTQINIKWTDNSRGELGFKIERRTSTGTYSQIATVGPNTNTYNDTGLARNTRYFYRVRAYNSAGDSSYSNEATAKTRP